jgi:glucokinase
MLEPRLGCPVHLLNDARAATLGEFVFGRGRGAGTMVFFGLGTGVGGGVVVDGKLRLGALGAAGEIGHQTVLPDGPLCGCGNRGCLETLASGSAIAAEGVRLFLSGNAPRLHEICGGELARVSPETMAQAARSGDAAVRAALTRAGEWLGLGAANLVTALHPELVVLGGGVAELDDLLLDPVRAAIRRRVGIFPADDVRVERSALGSRAGLLGAIALAARGGAV